MFNQPKYLLGSKSRMPKIKIVYKQANLLSRQIECQG